MFMNSKKPSLGDIIYQLIKYHPATSDYVSNVSGVNVTKVAELIGLPQPTLKKILDGKTRSLRFETEELFKSFFDVDSSQLKGERAIEWVGENSDALVLDIMNVEAANNTQQNNFAALMKLMAEMDSKKLEKLINAAETIAKDNQ